MAKFIDRGDRVVNVDNARFQGSDDLSEHQGKHGKVLSNDGWGLCEVLLDDGTSVYAWNGADLRREE